MWHWSDRGSLAEGHCLIVPSEHASSTRQVDESVWTELRNFKKCLLQVAMAQVRSRAVQSSAAANMHALVPFTVAGR